MKLMKATVTVLKSRYKKLLRKYMSTEDRFGLYYAEVDEAIGKLLDAHSALERALTLVKDDGQKDKLLERKKVVEERVTALYDKRKEAEAKETEYAAKIESAVAINEAYRACDVRLSKADQLAVTDVIADCEKELARLEAETKTLDFVAGLE